MKIIDISKCDEEIISYINELQNKYAELEKINKDLDKSNITIFEENNYLIKENRRLNNIINEIEKALDENVELTYVHNGKRQYNKTLTEGGLLFRDYIKSKLQELKGSDKE